MFDYEHALAAAIRDEEQGNYHVALSRWRDILRSGHGDMDLVMDHIDATKAWAEADVKPVHGCPKVEGVCRTVGCEYAMFEVVRRDRNFEWRG